MTTFIILNGQEYCVPDPLQRELPLLHYRYEVPQQSQQEHQASDDWGLLHSAHTVAGRSKQVDTETDHQANLCTLCVDEKRKQVEPYQH